MSESKKKAAERAEKESLRKKYPFDPDRTPVNADTLLEFLQEQPGDPNTRLLHARQWATKQAAKPSRGPKVKDLTERIAVLEEDLAAAVARVTELEPEPAPDPEKTAEGKGLAEGDGAGTEPA